ncbi:hypothetical protein QBC46DRAFT_219352, partial [Diplogelasinospora grovesii]
AAVMAGKALAITQCVQSQFYCGFTLLDSQADIAIWKPRIDAALAARGLPADADHEFNSLFFCSDPNTVVLDEYCFDQPSFRCQPSSAAGCGSGVTKNDCC